MTSRLCSLAGALYLCALPLCLSAQEADPPPAAGAAPTPSVRTLPTPAIRPYDKVITKDAKSDHGVFSVHKLSGKVYYEIPKSQLGREFLWVSQISRTTPGVGYGGQTVGNRVVRWERSENRVLLRDVSHEVVADAALPIARAVEAANNATIIMAFNIEALGKGEAPVIEVTRLFTTEVPEFSARNRLRARGFDGSRSFVERVKSFPENIEVEASQTYTSPPDVPGLSTGAPSPTSVFFGGMKPGSATVVMHYSMVKLPENPMTPRIADSRVGYFSISQTNYGIEEHRAPKRVYITRWRLEKKDPSAELSEPVKPIVFYIDPATPAKWVPYMKRGVEVWQKAFEGAGFKNAILAKDAPSPLEDPEWSPEDARYSVIRWLPSTIENASGPHVSDPRTGEILTSDIQFYHNVMNLVRDWYFVQVAHLDPRAQKLPMPDDLMGELIQQVCTHEVGHTLGLQHNMKASSMYPAEKVHDREWVRKMGHSPSIMDYARFNYVAQPEDKIDLKDLIPRIGPYDEFAILWGYKPIAGADPEKHKPTLDQWARKQDEVPWLRFSTAKANGADPGEQAEAVGDADAVKSTALGMKNLARIADLLIPATATRGENYDELEELYVRLLAQWTREMNHVASIVGGYNSQEKHVGQEGLRFLPIAKERQSEAVRFLNENAFKTPEFAIRREILRRIEPSGVLARLKTYQQLVLNNLLDPARFTRLIEQEAMDGAKSYRPGHFLSDLRKGIWSELGAGQVNVDAYRRSLQHAYLQVLSEKINGRSATEEQRPYLRGELRDLQTEIARAVPRAADRATRLHLEDARDQVAKALDPKFAAPVDFRIPLVVRSSGLELDCWRDYEAELRQ